LALDHGVFVAGHRCRKYGWLRAHRHTPARCHHSTHGCRHRIIGSARVRNTDAHGDRNTDSDRNAEQHPIADTWSV